MFFFPAFYDYFSHFLQLVRKYHCKTLSLLPERRSMNLGKNIVFISLNPSHSFFFFSLAARFFFFLYANYSSLPSALKAFAVQQRGSSDSRYKNILYILYNILYFRIQSVLCGDPLETTFMK